MSHAIVTDPCLSAEVLQQIEDIIMFYKGIYSLLILVLHELKSTLVIPLAVSLSTLCPIFRPKENR